MRSIWIFLSSVAVVVAIGGTFYHFVPWSGTDAEPAVGETRLPSVEPQVVVIPGSNPLLAATEQQLDMWIPLYPIACGEIVFGVADDRARHFSFCIREIRNRVAFYANLALSDDDVLDPRVRAHWRATVRRR